MPAVFAVKRKLSIWLKPSRSHLPSDIVIQQWIERLRTVNEYSC